MSLCERASDGITCAHKHLSRSAMRKKQQQQYGNPCPVSPPEQMGPWSRQSWDSKASHRRCTAVVVADGAPTCTGKAGSRSASQREPGGGTPASASPSGHTSSGRACADPSLPGDRSVSFSKQEPSCALSAGGSDGPSGGHVATSWPQCSQGSKGPQSSSHPNHC